MSIQRMIYNKITLSFSGKDEGIFLKKYFSDSVIQFRVAFLLLIFLYGIFGYLDLMMVPRYIHIFHLIRYGIVIPVFLVVLIVSFTKVFSKIWQVLLLISFIVGGTGISVMTVLVPENYAYYAGLLLVFFAGYFFVKLRFFLASIAGWLTLILFNIGAIFYADTSGMVLITHNFFFISANLIGMVAAYNIEYQTRRNFFLNQKLDMENLFVEELNKNLELTIKERTKELVKAKEKAEESDRLKSAFLANMSHEIRTPMNGILGFSSLLQEPNLSGEEQQEYIDLIEKSGRRMLNIINDIVDISKIEAGLMNVNIKRSNINDQISYICNFFKPEADSKGLKLSHINSLPGGKAIIKTDPEKLYAILTNLVKNAIKYTNTGKVELGYEIKGAILEFFVRDTGIGIPINRQKAIFERFIQADISDIMVRQGAGLGLSISKAFLEMLGGDIWVESEEGKGSTFYFTLPYDPLVSEEIENKNDSNDPTGDSLNDQALGLKILIAEDDELSSKFLVSIVKNISREILSAVTGVQAVAALRNNPDIDLILMDIKMPDLDGYEATRQIRQFNKEVVIIAQTAFGLSGDKEKVLEAGCDDYVAKPINRDYLLTLIEKYFRR